MCSSKGSSFWRSMDFLNSNNVHWRSPITKPNAFFSWGDQGVASHCMAVDLCKWLHDGAAVSIAGNLPCFHRKGCGSQHCIQHKRTVECNSATNNCESVAAYIHKNEPVNLDKTDHRCVYNVLVDLLTISSLRAGSISC